MSLLPIERGVPIPPPRCKEGGKRKGGKRVYPWREMKPGDSFFVAVEPSSVNRIQSQLSTIGAHQRDWTGKSYTTRIVEGGVRVWRTA